MISKMKTIKRWRHKSPQVCGNVDFSRVVDNTRDEMLELLIQAIKANDIERVKRIIAKDRDVIYRKDIVKC